ncbi:MAG: CPBP family intramembrane metalloprotease [Opitutales bacterium]|nr:CPBP family intramembrane metalloprotease [Opitutales bacterium]
MLEEVSQIELLKTNPAYFIYIVAMGICCLGCLVATIVRAKDPMRTLMYADGMVRRWELGWLNFLLWIWVMVMSGFGGAVVASAIVLLLKLPEEEAKTWGMIAGTFSMQAGMLISYLVYQFFLPFHLRLPLSVEENSINQSTRKGLYFFLASMPVLFAISWGWQGIILLLNQLGLNIQLQEQDFVTTLMMSGSIPEVVSMSALAVVVAPAVEEIVFRAGIYRFLKGKSDRSTAMIISAAIFALIHFNALGFPVLLALGVVLCLAYERTGDIRVPMVIHAVFNLNSVVLILLQPIPA